MSIPERQREPNGRESETRTLEHTTAEKREIEDTAQAELEESLNNSTHGRSFHLDFYNRRDRYRGRIVLLGGNEKKVFDGVDIPSICEFISRHLPELTKAPSSGRFFDNIVFHQESRVLKKSETLKAFKPFYVDFHWNLPVIPTDDNLDIDTKTYAVEVAVMDCLGKKVVARNDDAAVLSSGLTRYNTNIPLKGLDPGNYLLRIQVSTALGRVKESSDIKIIVGS